MIVFDIETEALSIDQIKKVCKPFDPGSLKNPGNFNPEDVRLGRMVDKAKIDAKIEAARQSHEAAVTKYESDLANGESNHWQSVIDSAALYANTGSVLAIGFKSTKGEQCHFAVNGVSERTMLNVFWKTYQDMQTQRRSMVGWNIKDFDVPFIVQRSFVLSLEVPSNILTPNGYLNPTFVDLMKIWQCGSRPNGNTKAGMGSASLDTVAKACGLPGKPDDCTGAEFAAMLRSDDPDKREAAKSYLSWDIDTPFQLAERFGVS